MGVLEKFIQEVNTADKGDIINHTITKEKIEVEYEKGHIFQQTAEGFTFISPSVD